MGEICDAFDDYLALRRRMMAHVKLAGPAGLSPRAFAASWADRLRPWLLATEPSGRHCAPDDALTVHFGRRLNPPLSGRVAWAWRETDNNPEQAVGLQRTEAWNFVIEQAVPLAKLALSGRQHALMVYPELERILADFTDAGLDVRFAPGFEWPQGRDLTARKRAARSYAEVSRAPSFTCDLTGDRIAIDDAQLLTPWEFRRSTLPHRFRARLADGPLDADSRLALDWSNWIIRADLSA